MLGVTIVGTEWELWDITMYNLRCITLTSGYGMDIYFPSICGESLYRPTVRLWNETYLN